MNYRACFTVYLRRQAYRPATVKSYAYALNDYIAYFRRAWKRDSILKNFVPRRLDSYKSYLLNARQLRPSTVNRRLSALSAFARFLLGRGLLAYNPLELVARVDSAGIDKTRPLAAWEEVQSFRSEVGQDILELPGRLIIELLYTGIGVRELCDLRYDEKAGPENIRVGERSIKLHGEAKLALSHYLLLRPILWGEYLIAGEAADYSLKPAAVYRLLRKFSKKIAARITVRDLRLARFVLASEVAGAVEEEAA